jgi:hypothetical protein
MHKTKTKSTCDNAAALRFRILRERKPLAIITFDVDTEPDEVQKTTVYGVSELDGEERYIEHFIGAPRLSDNRRVALAAMVVFPNHQLKLTS